MKGTIVLVGLALVSASCRRGPREFQPDYDKYTLLQRQLKAVFEPIQTNQAFWLDLCTNRSEAQTATEGERDAVYRAAVSVLKTRTMQDLIDADTAGINAELLDPYIDAGRVYIVINDAVYRVTPKTRNGIIVDIDLARRATCSEDTRGFVDITKGTQQRPEPYR